MKQLFVCLAVLVFAGALFAGPGGISGQVVDNRTGDPIASAMVKTQGAQGGSGHARTDAHGYYLIDGLKPDDYKVAATATGYEREVYPRGVAVQPDEVTRGVDFRLRREANPRLGAIAGRVTDARTGEPVPKATVIARHSGSWGKAQTDRHGYYLISGLEPGRYEVGVKARHYRPQVYPQPVAVRAGEVTRGIDFALEPKPRPGAIVGRVTDARTGESLRGALVIARGENGAGKAVTDARGIYRLGHLPPGRYQAFAARRGYEPAVFPRPVPVLPGSAVKGIDFALWPLNISDN